MHSYSTDKSNRPVILGLIGVLSYLMVNLRPINIGPLGRLISEIGVAPPNTMSISWGLAFGFILLVFNKWLWKTSILQKTGVIKIPDLSGNWKGYIATSYEDVPDEDRSGDYSIEGDLVPIDAELSIKQSWLGINVNFNPSTSSSSDSRGATILTGDGQWPSLTYQYENRPQPNSQNGMEMHHGTADLELKDENGERILEGVYYTGPGRKNHGKMYFKMEDED